MASPITTEDYLKNEMVKVNKCQMDDKPNESIFQFAKMHNSECLNKMEMERKETEPIITQAARFGNAENNETSQPKSNKTRENQELHKQTQMQGTFTIKRSRWIRKKQRYFLITRTL